MRHDEMTPITDGDETTHGRALFFFLFPPSLPFHVFSPGMADWPMYQGTLLYPLYRFLFSFFSLFFFAI